MDCRTARLLLDLSWPRLADLDPADAQAVLAHLGDCPECGSLAKAEENADRHISQTMRAIVVPERGRGRLRQRLTRERRSWYRRQLVGAGGLGALAALVAWVVWLVIPHELTRVPVNLETAMFDFQEKQHSSPDAVRDWFQQTYHVQTLPPASFNYHYLASYDLGDYQGKRVPKLMFQRGEFWATVLILSDKDFDFNQVVEQPGYNVQFLRSPTDTHFAFVVLYTSDRLDWFLTQGDEKRLGAFKVPSGNPQQWLRMTILM